MLKFTIFLINFVLAIVYILSIWPGFYYGLIFSFLPIYVFAIFLSLLNFFLHSKVDDKRVKELLALNFISSIFVLIPIIGYLFILIGVVSSVVITSLSMQKLYFKVFKTN
jgi:hypothetical protein